MGLHRPLGRRGTAALYGLFVLLGIGLYILFPSNPAASYGTLIAFWMLMLVPVARLDVAAEYTTGKDIEAVLDDMTGSDGTVVRSMERQGFDLVDSGDDGFTFETYRSRLHRWLDRPTRVRFDMERENRTVRTTISVDGTARRTTTATVEEADGTTVVAEEGHQEGRVSLMQLVYIYLGQDRMRRFLDGEDYAVRRVSISPRL